MAKKSKKHQSKSEEGGIVYSTNPGWNPFEALSNLIDDTADDEGNEVLTLHFEKKGRNGKPVTLVKNWASEASLKETGKAMQQHCGVGGSIKNGVLLLQGDQREKIEAFASANKLKTKRVGA
ncbi:MAG: translation initiation factor [Cryomorphaceae bacterium]|nr:translation initiation factor [Cryomorphaceae bacterium]